MEVSSMDNEVEEKNANQVSAEILETAYNQQKQEIARLTDDLK